ncbi:MAG: protein of unknown function (DUF1995) [Phormidesmis priestleyi Ana]|uniref:DUF1995 domain-containing protein n=1 Tax=Phormidesmis priestleyi Ana TaxID=1666911 RepID=A0A0P7ZVI1_9CYAN|nr:MAG: protein of unknown function (DUF1995) [Phormidesmis priestleyi Ana]
MPPLSSHIPSSLTEATEQAQSAVQAALQDGYTRLQVEMVIPEIKHQPIAEQFLTIFADQQFKVFFPDAGAAALARRDWQNPDFVVRGLGELTEPIEADDDLYLIVNPSSIEVGSVEALCNEAADRPVVLLNPQLEDVAVVGIGYAARQLRERFLSQIESCYYVRPLDNAAVYRCYPGPWQVWRETAPGEYEWVSDVASKPSGEDIDRILNATNDTAENLANGEASRSNSSPNTGKTKTNPRKKGLLAELQQFLKALSQ